MPGDMRGKAVNMVMVEDRGTQNTLACPACGTIFEVDARTNHNLVWDKAYKGFVARCPDCKATQMGENPGDEKQEEAK